MRKTSIKSHLKHYSIFGKRSTTIHHAFASAVAPTETYNPERLDAALRFLGLDPEKPLTCFYCRRNEAQTWDHLVALVKDKRPSGFGHTLGNLVPACRDCNSRKGNRHFIDFLSNAPRLIELLQHYQREFLLDGPQTLPDSLALKLNAIEEGILRGMREADALIGEWRQSQTHGNPS